MASEPPALGTGNLLLDSLPAVERTRLLERGVRRTMEAGDELLADRGRISSVWFPTSAVVSVLTTLGDRTAVETATIGREGVVGAVVFLGDDRMRNGRAVIQLGGELLGVPVDRFRAVLGEGGKLHDAMLDYTRALLFQHSQSAACSAAHSVRQRLARWLLQTTDRVGRDEVRLTQHFLAEILHARRASVTDALASLERDGLVRRGRARIEVCSRADLESAACECYRAVRGEYDRIIAASS